MRRFSFAAKIACALLLAWAADRLFLFEYPGANLGYYALALLAAAAALRPAILRSRQGLAGLALALGAAIMLIEDPSLLAAALYWCALAFAVLAPRIARFDDAWRWAKRLLLHGLTVAVAPLLDMGRARKAKARGGRARPIRYLPLLALPVIGSLIFFLLFASANPLIGDALARLNFGLFASLFSAPRLVVWAVGFWLAWAMLRPMALLPLRPAREDGPGMTLPGVSVASVTLSLIAFNALFAVQNALDIAFLWSGAPLPEGVTLADYAHRGAYPLIATALLAGLFVLVTMKPGSETAARPLIRQMVTLWVAQNILLVASSMLRTFDYVDAYSLTRLRIAALIWMGLVALGLALICVRLWRGRSDAWLINANAAAALLVLAGCSVVDLGRMAAAWNVRHAREAGGRGAALDLCYLNGLGPSALLPIIELEGRTRDRALKARLAWSRNAMMDRMEPVLADWHGWTWRNDRRMRTAERLIAEKRLPRYRADRRPCTGIKQQPLTADTAR